MGRPKYQPINSIGSLACQSTKLVVMGSDWLMLLSVVGDGVGDFPGVLLQQRHGLS